MGKETTNQFVEIYGTDAQQTINIWPW